MRTVHLWFIYFAIEQSFKRCCQLTYWLHLLWKCIYLCI